MVEYQLWNNLKICTGFLCVLLCFWNSTVIVINDKQRNINENLINRKDGNIAKLEK